jgi:hypothetical protein
MKNTLVATFIALSLSLSVSTHAATIDLPASGQTKCYDTAGVELTSCAGTGQDGEKKMGVSWDEITRFTNNGDGTITDTLTGLIWLQNANCTDTVGGVDKASGNLSWANALTWSNNLASGACGLTDSSSIGQWRLPSCNELQSLINYGQSNNATWLGTKGFNAVQSGEFVLYWSSTTDALYIYWTWGVYMDVGVQTTDSRTFNKNYVWPVRSGQ